MFCFQRENSQMGSKTSQLAAVNRARTGFTPSEASPQLSSTIHPDGIPAIPFFQLGSQNKSTEFNGVLNGSATNFLQESFCTGSQNCYLKCSIQMLKSRIQKSNLTVGQHIALGRANHLSKALNNTQELDDFFPKALTTLRLPLKRKQIFISVDSTKRKDSYDIYMWSSAGEILLLCQRQSYEGVSSEIISQLQRITESTVIFDCFIPGNIPFEYLLALSVGNNHVVLRSFSCYSSSAHPTQQWVTYDGRFIIMQQYNELSYLMTPSAVSWLGSPSFNQVLNNFKKMWEKFIQVSNKIAGDEPDSMVVQELTCLIINLMQLEGLDPTDDRHILDVLFQIFEFLEKRQKTPVNNEVKNFSLYCEIGMMTHFAQKMPHCLKCRVCKKKNKVRGRKNGKCPKSKYTCGGCSQFYKQKVHICVTCFQKFHENISFYMESKKGKGLKTGVQKSVRRLQKQLSDEDDS